MVSAEDAAAPALSANVQGKPARLQFDASTLRIELESRARKATEVPLRQVLWAEGTQDVVTLQFLSSRRGHLKLRQVTAQVARDDRARIASWVEALLSAAYKGLQRRRRFRVFVNPISGKRKGPTMFRKVVEPILNAARCHLETTHTSRHGEVADIARELSLDQFDAVMCLSGDGLLHEVINGFSQHASPNHALHVPLVPIPTGSANATSLNLLGLKSGFDVVAATLNAIKGSPMPVDVFSVTFSGRRVLSLLSQTVGFLADCDIGTEHLRWMGDSRFIWGAVRELFTYKQCPVELSIKVEQSDKHEIWEAYHEAREEVSTPESPWDEETEDNKFLGLPPIKQITAVPERSWEWTTLDCPLLTVSGGQGPYVNRDVMQFPVSMPHDGLLDLIVWEQPSRTDVLKLLLGGMNKGECFWSPAARYYKAGAYRLRPLAPGAKVRFAIDGEVYPFDSDVLVEVHRGLGRLLSPQNDYASFFELGPDAKAA